jgi:ParB-like chromosome segregation protein Spo0J
MQGNEAMGNDVNVANDTNIFEPAQRLAELLEEAKSGQPHPRPSRLPLDAITKMPELFQPRGMSEKHIGDLSRAIQNFGEVDPIIVLPVGERAILIDGHHRFEAYERTAKVAEVPVSYFEGTPEEAVLVAGQANSKAKLPMTSQERQNFAWRLVQLNQHSKAKIAQAAGVSEAQVANMRVVRKKLGEEAFDYTSWFRARHHAQGHDDDPMSEDDREQWKQDLADRFADRLARTFSTTLADRPEIAAMALASYFGRRLQEVVDELQGFLPEDDEDDEF